MNSNVFLERFPRRMRSGYRRRGHTLGARIPHCTRSRSCNWPSGNDFTVGQERTQRAYLPENRRRQVPTRGDINLQIQLQILLRMCVVPMDSYRFEMGHAMFVFWFWFFNLLIVYIIYYRLNRETRRTLSFFDLF